MSVFYRCALVVVAVKLNSEYRNYSKMPRWQTILNKRVEFSSKPRYLRVRAAPLLLLLFLCWDTPAHPHHWAVAHGVPGSCATSPGSWLLSSSLRHLCWPQLCRIGLSKVSGACIGRNRSLDTEHVDTKLVDTLILVSSSWTKSYLKPVFSSMWLLFSYFLPKPDACSMEKIIWNLPNVF